MTLTAIPPCGASKDSKGRNRMAEVSMQEAFSHIKTTDETARLRIERDISRLMLRGDAAASLAEDICTRLTREALCTCAAIVLWDGDHNIVHTAAVDPGGALSDFVQAPSTKALAYAHAAPDAPRGAARQDPNTPKGGIHTLPLQHSNRIFGVLSVGLIDENPSHRTWLAPLAADIAIGLGRHRHWRRLLLFTDQSPQEISENGNALTEFLTGMVYRCRHDDHWTMTFLSGSVTALTGYRPDQLIHNRETAYGDLIHPDYRERVRNAVQDAVDHGQPFKITYPINRASGETRWVWEQGRAVPDDTGRAIGLEGYITDITDLKRTEEALRESEKRYRLLADNTMDIIWQMDMHLRFTYVNPVIEEVLGYAPDEFFGTMLSDHCSPEALQSVQTTILQALEAKTSHYHRTSVLSLTHKNGESIPFEVHAWFIYGKTPGPIGIQGISRDIRERLAAEDMARRQGERLQTIMDNIPLLITFLDPESGRLWINQAGEKALGLSQSELDPDDILRACYPDPEYRRYVWNFINRAEDRWEDFDTQTADGSVRNTVWKNVRLTDGSIISIGEDVTEVRRSQKRQQELEQQLRQAQKMEAVGRLAGGVAHDFNNLLAVILGYADLLLDTLPPSHVHYEPVSDIYKAATRARDLTRQLLAFSRKQVLSIAVLDVNKVVTGFNKLIRRVIGEDIALALKLASGLLQVRADVSQLEQVLMNLAVNARHAMPEGGRLVIETSRVELDRAYAEYTPGTQPGDYALITVSDTGCGMDPTTLHQIFEPFFTTKGKDGGTGLGLSTVYGIIKQHGGNIWVYSEPGQGATFKIYLPLATGDSPVDSASPPLPEPARLSASATVLVAEDDPNVRRLVGHILGPKGYQVLAANSVDDAVRIARSHAGSIDVLLSDIIMPGMNGPDLYARLVSIRPEMKVIFMSGYSGEAVSRYGALDPETPFLQKPFSARSLLAKIAQTLGS